MKLRGNVSFVTDSFLACVALVADSPGGFADHAPENPTRDSGRNRLKTRQKGLAILAAAVALLALPSLSHAAKLDAPDGFALPGLQDLEIRAQINGMLDQNDAAPITAATSHALLPVSDPTDLSDMAALPCGTSTLDAMGTIPQDRIILPGPGTTNDVLVINVVGTANLVDLTKSYVMTGMNPGTLTNGNTQEATAENPNETYVADVSIDGTIVASKMESQLGSL